MSNERGVKIVEYQRGPSFVGEYAKHSFVGNIMIDGDNKGFIDIIEGNLLLCGNNYGYINATSSDVEVKSNIFRGSHININGNGSVKLPNIEFQRNGWSSLTYKHIAAAAKDLVSSLSGKSISSSNVFTIRFNDGNIFIINMSDFSFDSIDAIRKGINIKKKIDSGKTTIEIFVGSYFVKLIDKQFIVESY